MNSEKRPILVLFGPMLFLGIVVLLLFRISSTSGFWLFGIAVATLLAGWVSYLVFLEMISQKKRASGALSQKGERGRRSAGNPR